MTSITSPGFSWVRRQKMAGPIDSASRWPEKTAFPPAPGILVKRYQAAFSGCSGASIWLRLLMPLTSIGASTFRRRIRRREGTKGALASASGASEGAADGVTGNAEALVWLLKRRLT